MTVEQAVVTRNSDRGERFYCQLRTASVRLGSVSTHIRSSHTVSLVTLFRPLASLA